MQNPADYQPPSDLLNKVMLRLDQERELLNVRRKFWSWAIISGAMVLLCATVWRGFVSEITQSGFSEYLTLAFSDFQTVLGSWQDFSLSLLESLPVVATVEMLATILALLASVRLAARYSKSNYLSLKI